MDEVHAQPSDSGSKRQLLIVMVLAAMAGGLGWGIRGQYGHETGAMIAGLLVGLVLVSRLCPSAWSIGAARAVALCTAGISFGGSMTYGQTVGLTHNPAMVGNWSALWWGMLGLAIKGGLWIGFGGLFLGIGLSRLRYRWWEVLALFVVLLSLVPLGMAVLNHPFDPAARQLPTLYFSASWDWEPNNSELKPRPECWGGLFIALAGASAYVSIWRKDKFARNLAIWGVIGGGLGFPIGQAVQAAHAWNAEALVWLDQLVPVNWWNMMETTFGAVFGAVLAFGLWLNRQLIDPLDHEADVAFPPLLEIVLAAAYVALIIFTEFIPVRPLLIFAEFGILMGSIPIILSLAGKWWPFLFTLPIVALPIAGKTVRQLAYREEAISTLAGWGLYLVLPLLVTIVIAISFAVQRDGQAIGKRYVNGSLLLCTWLYFGLNFAFFRFPWPWQEWTTRTPNAIIFTVCTVGLSVAAISSLIKDQTK